eukprot:CAMPEP_0115869278 /NCGR_PEP_ID=MMETSP0287-20121206/21728_1 /TAXON_ID=412157 /ORGANISM="Chrysochromulina rotalis, Strain UIO044" /LENGTH=122 /DNA_ID=CAMNT_0003323963 /DNA_START=876 /DNA_END=1241 /DNA_ORIENTATION=-
MSQVLHEAAHRSFMYAGFASHSPLAAHVVHAPDVSRSRHVGAVAPGQPHDFVHAVCMYLGLAVHSPSAAHSAHGRLSSSWHPAVTAVATASPSSAAVLSTEMVAAAAVPAALENAGAGCSSR